MVLTVENERITLPVTRRKHVCEYTGFSFQAMGSPCEVMFRARSEASARDLEESVVRWVAGFEAACSRYRPESTVSRINRGAGDGEWVEAEADVVELLALCDWFHWLTGGVFDPTAAPLMQLWDYHKPRATLPDSTLVASTRGLVGWGRVQREENRVRLPEKDMAIDLGGVGKEYAVDRVMEMVLQAGVRDVLVNFGHDLRVHGSPPEGGAWRIGLEDPTRPGRCWCGVGIEEGSVCTSGNYLRYLEIAGRKYGHIVDPRTGYPVDNGCLSVSVVAPSCTEAGMLCTAGFILGRDEGIELISHTFGAEGCIWTAEGAAQTGGFRRHVIRSREK